MILDLRIRTKWIGHAELALMAALSDFDWVIARNAKVICNPHQVGYRSGAESSHDVVAVNLALLYGQSICPVVSNRYERELALALLAGCVC